MRKGRFISGVLALSIMLMGAGYAAWSQNFAVTNAIDTGELSYTVATANPTTQSYATLENVVSEDGNTLTTTITEAYPGATFEYDIVVTNDGTVGIKNQTMPTDATDDNVTVTYSISEANADIAVGSTETIHVKVEFGEVDENSTYNFDTNFVYTQFNN